MNGSPDQGQTTGESFVVLIPKSSLNPPPPLASAPSKLMTTEDLARLLKVDPSTVRRWRTAQPIQGPPFIKLSERVTMYNIDDVERWLASKRVAPEAA